MEHKKRMKLLNAALVLDVLAIIGIFVGGYLNSMKIIGGCIMFLILSLILMLRSTE